MFNGLVGRYFVKDALPRIRWANPSLEIEVDKVWKAEGPVKQDIELTFGAWGCTPPVKEKLIHSDSFGKDKNDRDGQQVVDDYHPGTHGGRRR